MCDQNSKPNKFEDDEGLINLADTDFNFEDYFSRFGRGETSAQENAEWDARVLGLFCRDVFEERKVPTWVLEHLANEFSKILAGGKWNDSFPLPWHPADPVRSRSEEIALQIFCDIANEMKRDCTQKITSVIKEIADRHHVSYETARAAWYKHRKHFSDAFLKSDSEN